MATDLIQAVQVNLGFPPLHKIDPNTQKIKTEDGQVKPDRFSQATIPATLIAMYIYSQADAGAEAILHADLSNDWSKVLFADKKENVIRRIASYSGNSLKEVIEAINHIADEAIRLIREQVTDKGTIADIKTVLADARANVLTYLPADLQLGELLDDNTMDDKTNKMEGPVSGLMHTIGSIFSAPDTDETKANQ